MNGRRDFSSAIFNFNYIGLNDLIKKCFPTENCLLYTFKYKSKKYFYTLADIIFSIILWNCIRYIRSIMLQSIV